MENTKPIGIFDSGVGGLTVAKAIRQILPNEDIVYFGDTSHLPYGDKSPETIRHYSSGIARFLVEQNCKIIVIACNSASANAFTRVQEIAGDAIPVLNVIDPIVNYVTQENEYKQVGVIGTKSTINSNTYVDKIKAKSPQIIVSTLATPLFVPMIEEGFIFDDISNAIIRTYLSRHEIGNIQSLILGCTHYPIIKNQISKFYNFEVDIVDSAQIVARALQNLLIEKGLAITKNKVGKNKFYVSDITQSFKVISKMFFEEEINLELKNIWEDV